MQQLQYARHLKAIWILRPIGIFATAAVCGAMAAFVFWWKTDWIDIEGEFPAALQVAECAAVGAAVSVVILLLLGTSRWFCLSGSDDSDSAGRERKQP